MSDEKYNRIELLALIKSYNKTHSEKLKNIDKLKKEELLDICKKHGLLTGNEIIQPIDLRNISKHDLLRDVEIWYLKQNKNIPSDVLHLKKNDLIDFMELNDIKHYTSDIVEKEIKEYQKQNILKKIIVYNIIRYDNIDINKIDNDLETFINDNSLDTNIENLQQYSILLNDLYTAYEKFCINTNQEFEKDKIKSFPKIKSHLNKFV